MATALMEEIMGQPAALANVRKYYASPGAIPSAALKKLGVTRETTILFTGMGSSLNAAYPAQAYLTAAGRQALVWETAELLHHHLKFLADDTLLVVISQSGETAEVIELLQALPPATKVLAVTNVEASPLSKRGNLLLPMLAGQQATVSTKTYTCAVAVLMYLAFAITGSDKSALSQALLSAAEAEEKILDRHEVLIPPAIEFLNHPPYVALMSRGADLASAYQGALMLKEVARMAAEPISAAQFRHGPIEIVNPAHCYIIFARHQECGEDEQRGHTTELLLNLADDIRAHNGRVLLISDRPAKNISNLRLIEVDSICLGLGTLADVVVMQLLAHDYAVRAGFEPGNFWIAEGVTRSE